jgi:hypothetical protein
MLYSGGPVFVPGNSRHLPRFTRLAVFRSEVFLYGFQRGDMIGSPAMIVAPYGNGVVLLISPHPELTPGSEHVVSKSVEILANCRPEEARD